MCLGQEERVLPAGDYTPYYGYSLPQDRDLGHLQESMKTEKAEAARESL